MHHRSQNGMGGGTGPERPVSLAWGKKGLVGRGTHLKCESGKLIGHFEKAPGPSYTQANIIPGEQRVFLSHSLSLAPWLVTCTQWTCLFFPWATCMLRPHGPWTPGGSFLTLLPTWWGIHWCDHTLSPGSTWSWGPASSVAHGWWAPHPSSRRELEMNSSRGQATLPGWGICLFSSPLWGPEDCTLKRSRNSNHWLLSWSCWDHGV